MAARATHRGPRHQPQRTCVGCRKVRSKSELRRLVMRDGALVADGDGNASGRGAYVCAQGDCLARAAKRLAKALRADVSGAAMERMASVLGRTGVA